MANAPLRGCPVCGTKVEDVKLGLRDYRWLKLPGREAPMDLDFVFEKDGRFLVLEFKPMGGFMPMGQRITLKQLVRTGHFDVLIVWHDDGDEYCEVSEMDRHGNLSERERMLVGRLANEVGWWREEQMGE